MKNITKTTKTLLFASLIVTMILTFNMVGNAQATYNVQNVENNNEKYDFLAKATSETGTWEEQMINGEHIELWKYIVVEHNDQTKHVVLNILVYDKHGNEVGDYDIEFKTKYDSATDTYDVYNTLLDETKKISREGNDNSLQTNGHTEIGSQIQPDGIVVANPYSIQVVNSWTNFIVSPDNEFGSDSYSQCGDSWYVDFTSNGSSGLREYSFSGQYYYLGWCIFPNNFERAYVKAWQGDWQETDAYNFHIGTHSEHDIDMSDPLTLQVVWYY